MTMTPSRNQAVLRSEEEYDLETAEKECRFTFRVSPLLRDKIQKLKIQNPNISQYLRDFLEFSEVLTQNQIDAPSFFHEIFSQSMKQITKNKISIYIQFQFKNIDVEVPIGTDNDTQLEPRFSISIE
jgi:hypothetical protein